MKSIDIDDDLYAFIAGQTKHIGESASDILRRLLLQETPASAVPAPVIAEQVDTTPAASPVAADIDTDDILALVTVERLTQLSKRVDQFLYILAALHALHQDRFERVEQIRGKNRTYFATSKEALLENGSSTNPKSIPDSPYWVVTNNNTAKKIAMLEQVMQQLGYAEEIIQQVLARFSPGN
ncbi:replication initiation negative regulator SeqA [Alteromonas halophila]|uniref:Negative modulator of initiation of replication n=1 Tax=Alteromonas halophila TaxID=516698 RepID=A0A918MVT6_9ALTE|nr:replication initiation negative regulator SeqA [Alteromonas halophila]GGW76079.1 negative modulator of initiation of replication [Alteromonas halophila]